ncbi:hypothetical protein [Limosilactobacillus reuteri]|uniref:hypothetical protein n=1 Tax=Limosilactobacillus reuteri TaxID=1598 RepID=UPI001E332ECB|nr:hypothetical protein [Limosilactobacillus reuteri]MCC4372692.1 hypothetical protein [Limosilactobacillus reuteri]
MTTPIKVVTLTTSELQNMLEQAVVKGVTKYMKEQRQTTENKLVTMPELIAMRKFGSRNTIAKYRDQIMAENPNQTIVAKNGPNYMFNLNEFKEWFMRSKEARKEYLKIDPRLRR